nr:hypothetical protein [Burkholderia cepacia]
MPLSHLLTDSVEASNARPNAPFDALLHPAPCRAAERQREARQGMPPRLNQGRAAPRALVQDVHDDRIQREQFLRRRAAQLALDPVRPRTEAATEHVVRETGDLGQRLLDARGDKRPRVLPRFHEPLADQFLDRASHGVARQLQLGGQNPAVEYDANNDGNGPWVAVTQAFLDSV